MPANRQRPTAATAAMLIAALAAGCNATSPIRGTGPAAAEPTGPTVAAPPEATQPNLPPVPAAQATFRFDSLNGVPTNKADSLATAIGGYARQRSLTLVRRGDPAAAYRVLGYLSAAGGTGGTQVSYVWDIVDVRTQRLLHRISGVEIAGEADADPWTGVDDRVLNAVAARTVEAIYAWLNQLPAGQPAAASAPAAPLGQAI